MGILCWMLGHDDAVYLGPAEVNITADGGTLFAGRHGGTVAAGHKLTLCRRCYRPIFEKIDEVRGQGR